MAVDGQPEARRVMAALAGRPEVGRMRVLMARDTSALEAAKLDRTRCRSCTGCRCCRPDVAVTTRRSRVRTGQRERRRRMVEGRLAEAFLAVTRLAVLRVEAALVDIRVATAAAVGLRRDRHRRLHVAGAARHGLMLALQRERRAPMIDTRGPPGVGGRVAGRACAGEGGRMRVLVATRARLERDALELLARMAVDAGDRAVGARQREGRRRVIEAGRRILEGLGHRMTGAAGVPQRAPVNIAVARHAISLQGQERARLVAGLAVRRDRRMLAAERVPRLSSMIEPLGVEWAELGVDPHVLDVAGDAVLGDLAMHTALQPYPLSHRRMARQALLRGHPPAGFVARLALAQPFQLRVWSRQAAG